jgi:protein phosphatase methylesterase 1
VQLEKSHSLQIAMSSLLRTSFDAPPPRPRPQPISDSDESSSDSSAASVDTVRPNELEQVAGPSHWTHYFDQELWLEKTLADGSSARYHVYVTPPTTPSKDPLFVCHHGAGSSGLSFAIFAQEIRQLLPNAGVLSLEARGHGLSVLSQSGEEVAADYSLDTLTSDALCMLQGTQVHFSWPALPPLVFVGHSLGAAVVTNLTTVHGKLLAPTLIGYAVLDVVEGSAIEALAHMKTYLAQRPSLFDSQASAIDWHTRTRTIRYASSAEVSVPSLLTRTPSGRYAWRTNLSATSPWWESWFAGMSARFLGGRGAKLLVLAGTDRLDRELMIGQMQGKFQLDVIPEAGHFVQEDVPAKLATLMVEFYRRNDRSQMVLPPKVSEMLAKGMKV